MGETTQIGQKIKKMREEMGLSLEALAHQSHITMSTLEKIESQELSPPLGQIVSLANILGITVGELFGDSGDSPYTIVRQSDREEVNRFSASYSKSCGYSYKGLGLQKRNRQMEPFIVTLNPTDEAAAESNQHIGEEFIFVLDGMVEVNLQDHKDILHPGDSIYYDSNIPHIISCHGEQPATILAVIYAKEEMIIL